MAKSLFNREISPSCSHCIHGKLSAYTEEIFCVKHGVTNRSDSCRHYKYDVLKRVPNRAQPSDQYKPEDFEI